MRKIADSFESTITAADIVDFLEKGLLENLVTLFKAEPSLYPLLTQLLADERIVVRLGVSALIESLAEEDPARAGRSVDALVPLIVHERATVRGDAAYLLGIVGREEAREELQKLTLDENSDVRDAAAEALDRLSASAP